MKNLGSNIIGSSTSGVQQPILLQDNKKMWEPPLEEIAEHETNRRGRNKTELSMTLVFHQSEQEGSESIYVPALALTARSVQSLTP
jgi:hypothetical protein